MQHFTLHNGIKMPALGLGTDYLNDEMGQELIEKALEIGYRLIDTAQMYKNEAEVGRAIKASKLKRQDLFIVTKIMNNEDESSTKKAIERSLKSLDTSYIDLLLIHHQYPGSKPMYKAMEAVYKEGVLKSIGVSNFGMKTYSEFIKHCEIVPMVNQCETNLKLQQRPLKALMKEKGTLLQSWSPFMAGEKPILKDEQLKKIALIYEKSPAQIILRFLIQEGVQVIPRSFKIEHIKENFKVFDFTLKEDDVELLRGFDENKSSFSWTSYIS